MADNRRRLVVNRLAVRRVTCDQKDLGPTELGAGHRLVPTEFFNRQERILRSGTWRRADS